MIAVSKRIMQGDDERLGREGYERVEMDFDGKRSLMAERRLGRNWRSAFGS
jgi:hypothetical protein